MKKLYARKYRFLKLKKKVIFCRFFFKKKSNFNMKNGYIERLVHFTHNIYFFCVCRQNLKNDDEQKKYYLRFYLNFLSI